MKNTGNLDKVLETVTFAARKHQGQFRKDQQRSPYVTHPLAVAKTILRIGSIQDTTILVAAILHDTIEDTPTTEAEIVARFGEETASIVLEVTDDKTLEKIERKRLQVVHAPDLSYPAKIIKLADKLTNCTDILNSPPKDWPMERRRDYIQWSADVISRICETNAAMEAAFDAMLTEAEEKLNFEVKSYESIGQRPWAPE